jgi:hypothetical protein
MRPAHQCCGKLVEVHAGGAWSWEPHATPPRFPAPPWYEVYGSATDCRQAFGEASPPDLKKFHARLIGFRHTEHLSSA